MNPRITKVYEFSIENDYFENKLKFVNVYLKLIARLQYFMLIFFL